MNGHPTHLIGIYGALLMLGAPALLPRVGLRPPREQRLPPLLDHRVLRRQLQRPIVGQERRVPLPGALQHLALGQQRPQ